MKYTSTRGDNAAFTASEFTASETIVKGLADDGGLYVPQKMPQIAKIPAGASYTAHAEGILQGYLDFTPDEISHCVNSAYSVENFLSAKIAPLHRLPNVSFLELFHGKTLAFKDMALSILPHLMQVSLKKTKNPRTQIILTATSGDTGVSALEGFKDIPGTKIIVFYPETGVSVIQKRHMITQTGSNVHVVGVRGNFDDAQSEVKRMFLDARLKDTLAEKGCEFSSANSINTGRLVPQIVYYFWAYSQLSCSGMSGGTPVNFVVPTGNFGNILACHYAKKMGLPVGKLICASNENKVLYDYFETGDFDSGRSFVVTNSPSMDILVPSNFERLVYELDGSLEKLNCLSAKQKFKMRVPDDFVGFYASQKETCAAIKRVFENHGYLIDPHTAVAYASYEKYARPSEETVIVSTASPYKFAKTVMTSLSDDYEKYDDFALLEKMSELTKTEVPRQFANLKSKEILHSGVVDVNEMENAVLQII